MRSLHTSLPKAMILMPIISFSYYATRAIFGMPCFGFRTFSESPLPFSDVLTLICVFLAVIAFRRVYRILVDEDYWSCILEDDGKEIHSSFGGHFLYIALLACLSSFASPFLGEGILSFSVMVLSIVLAFFAVWSFTRWYDDLPESSYKSAFRAARLELRKKK